MPPQRRHLAHINISHDDAVALLRELATPNSPTRAAVEANPARELGKRGIRLYPRPKQITLPPPEQIQPLVDQAQLLAGTKSPFGFAVAFVVMSGS